ncbi:MAG: DUF2480 family protein [Saprospiraceae bacterium]
MNETEGLLVNRVAESDLQTIALDALMPLSSIVSFDLKDYLFQGMILKEKDFRAALKAFDWSQFSQKQLAVYCSTDAIIPMWAYMLIATQASPFTIGVHIGTVDQVYEALLVNFINSNDWSYLQDKRVVVKGCSDKEIPASAFLAIGSQLRPFVQNLMYGEPCSTVPIFKRPRVL